MFWQLRFDNNTQEGQPTTAADDSITTNNNVVDSYSVQTTKSRTDLPAQSDNTHDIDTSLLAPLNVVGVSVISYLGGGCFGKGTGTFLL